MPSTGEAGTRIIGPSLARPDAVPGAIHTGRTIRVASSQRNRIRSMVTRVRGVNGVAGDIARLQRLESRPASRALAFTHPPSSADAFIRAADDLDAASKIDWAGLREKER